MDLRLGRVAAELPRRAPLAQQMPSIDRVLPEQPSVVAARLLRPLIEKPVLFADEALNMRQYGCFVTVVIHTSMFSKFRCPRDESFRAIRSKTSNPREALRVLDWS
jgi:hypothetical protein